MTSFTTLGINELHILGAARGVMTNLEAHTLIELLEDRRKTTFIHALRQLKQRDRIRTVFIDLSARMVAESGWSYRREEVAQRIFKNDKKISK